MAFHWLRMAGRIGWKSVNVWNHWWKTSQRISDRSRKWCRRLGLTANRYCQKTRNRWCHQLMGGSSSRGKQPWSLAQIWTCWAFWGRVWWVTSKNCFSQTLRTSNRGMHSWSRAMPRTCKTTTQQSAISTCWWMWRVTASAAVRIPNSTSRRCLRVLNGFVKSSISLRTKMTVRRSTRTGVRNQRNERSLSSTVTSRGTLCSRSTLTRRYGCWQLGGYAFFRTTTPSTISSLLDTCPWGCMQACLRKACAVTTLARFSKETASRYTK